jgi:hypothetical protein
VILKTLAGDFNSSGNIYAGWHHQKLEHQEKRQEKPEATPGHQEPVWEEQVHRQSEGVVDVDAIPSPQDEPVSATMVEEEEKAPVTVRMDIDPQSSVGNKTLLCQKPQATTQGRSIPPN